MKTKKMEVEEKTLPVIDKPDENSSKKGKILTLLFPAELQSAEGKEVKKDKNKPPTKVVIRRLPPKLTKEAFLEEFSPLPAHDYFHFVRGDLNLGSHAFSRAYVNFLNQEDIFSFKEKFDDYDIQDEKGKIYHAVVEFAPFQKIPRKNVIKKKLSKAGTLESDPKYIEFLQKLEESKNFINNPSEYFHETESSALKAKVVTTPLLEYLKKKKQKKIDLKNEIRQRKREAEKEKRKKEEEKRKAERERRKEEKKNLEKNKGGEEKGKKVEVKSWVAVDKSKAKFFMDKGCASADEKGLKSQGWFSENEPVPENQLDSVIPNDPAILEVFVWRPTTDKDLKPGVKTVSEDNRSLKSNESETNVGKPERKFSDFRARLIEEKQRKTFYKRDIEESKTVKTNQGSRRGVPDEKGDNYNIGNCSDTKDSGRKLPLDTDTKRHDYKVEVKETKSKFRYSEQRNRDREFRQKSSDCKTSKENQKTGGVELKDKVKDSEAKPTIKVSNLSEEEVKQNNSDSKEVDEPKSSSTTTDQISLPSRRKSLEIEREVVDTERKRSKSFHDVSSKEFSKFQADGKVKRCNFSDRARDENAPGNSSVQGDDNSKEGGESEKIDEESKKERRAERRIRNKVGPLERMTKTRVNAPVMELPTIFRSVPTGDMLLFTTGAPNQRMHPCDSYPTCTYAKDRPSLEIYRPGMGKFSKQRLSEKKEDGNCTSPVGTPYSGKSSTFVNKSGKKTTGRNDTPENRAKSEEASGKNNGENGKAYSEVRTMTFTRNASKEN